MTIHIKARNQDNSGIETYIDQYPDHCPVCKRRVDAQLTAASYNDGHWKPLFVSYYCPAKDCRAIFVGIYIPNSFPVTERSPFRLSRTELISVVEDSTFPEIINKVSPDFPKIFNEAHRAEQNGLLQICGPGYRKALEFLIKDYLISRESSEDGKERIKMTFLGTCIERYVDDARLKAVAHRAAWLGNDEIHYYRKWDTKDLQDLKRLIGMTVSWIDLVTASADYLQNMPDGG